MSSSGTTSVTTCKNMVTQMYTFNSWSKNKSVENGHSSMLPYVGFPGLSLTPIPESPLVDSTLSDDADHADHDKWLHGDLMDDKWKCTSVKNGSVPRHWLGKGTECSSLVIEENGEVETNEKLRDNSSKTCSVNVHVVQTTTFLPKDEPMTREEKRAHLCKLLLFAVCGFVIVAGIVLWIFSPAFT